MSIAEKLQTIAENEQKVYQAGKKSQYDEFWDAYQQNGTRYNWNSAFAGSGWNSITYKPKYPITNVKYASGMYGNSVLADTLVEMDFTNITSGAPFENGSNLKTIRKILVTENVIFTKWFSNCPKLENITIDGVIGNDISFKDSPLLTKESIISIISHLSTSTSAKTLTLSKTAVDNAYSDAGGVGEASLEWKGFIVNFSNWTISLV